MKSFSDYIINTSAIRRNLKSFKQQIKNVKVCAVVKANGYGIGAKNVVKAIDDEVDFYAVACFVEAKKLRGRTDKNILILNYVTKDVVLKCVNNNISITIFSLKQLEDVLKNNYVGVLKIHLAINTGMNRIGFGNENEFKKVINLAHKNAKRIFIEGIFTHFYNAENINSTKKQVCIFNHYIKILSQTFDITKIVKHASSSLASIMYKKYNYDMIRLGILMYGLVEQMPSQFEEVLSIKSKVVCLTNLNAGDSVGYDGAFVAKKRMTIATIPLGYADGVMRSFSRLGKVLLNGKFCNVVGKICMDMFMIDVTGLNVDVFDEVVLIGHDRFGNSISANKFAEWCGTIGYEVLTNIKQSRFNIKLINI